VISFWLESAISAVPSALPFRGPSPPFPIQSAVRVGRRAIRHPADSDYPRAVAGRPTDVRSRPESVRAVPWRTLTAWNETRTDRVVADRRQATSLVAHCLCKLAASAQPGSASRRHRRLRVPDALGMLIIRSSDRLQVRSWTGNGMELVGLQDNNVRLTDSFQFIANKFIACVL